MQHCEPRTSEKSNPGKQVVAASSRKVFLVAKHKQSFQTHPKLFVSHGHKQ
jgi:hypothetical protein